MTDNQALMISLVPLLIGILYILPLIISLIRKHHNMGSITVLNLLTGWTVLGWVISLVWAFSAVRPKEIK